jgi:ethanolamine utilization protein EutJ
MALGLRSPAGVIEGDRHAVVSSVLHQASSRFRSPPGEPVTPLSVGIDLGTASCVVAVVDADGRPVFIDAHGSGALADGVVVDFVSATAAVKRLKSRAEQAIGVPLSRAATAFPPGVAVSERSACRFVVERGGFDDVILIDEVTAAQLLLQVDNGVIVDVGGGSTGVGVVLGGELVRYDDVPGGGHHLDLILAGALHIDVERAERLKRAQGGAYIDVLRPGIERIAESIRRLSVGAEELPVHVAGGALMIPGAAGIVAERLGRSVETYPSALWITPLGIAKAAG